MKKTILLIMSMLLIAAALFSLSACDIFNDSKCKHDDAGESCLYCGVTDEKYFTFTLLEDGTYSVKIRVDDYRAPGVEFERQRGIAVIVKPDANNPFGYVITDVVDCDLPKG